LDPQWACCTGVVGASKPRPRRAQSLELTNPASAA
jgi:hypothetical protein